MQKIVTGIDVGTHQVKVVIARRPDNPREAPQILGTGYAESRGMKQGYVISVPDVARSIAAAVAQASRAAQVKVRRAYVGVGGVGLDEAFSRGETVVERGDSEITSRDIPRALSAAEGALAPSSTLNRKVIHTIPLRYSVDGMRVMGKSPIGMKGQRISVETFFITCLERHVHDLVSAVEEAGIEVEDIAASPLAASFVALNKMQKRVGCVLVNIGSETLSIIVFEDSIPMSVRVFPVGGTDITNDLALGLRISPEEAEQLKSGAVLGSTYPKRKIDDLISKRVSDMFKLVEAHLKKIGKNELLPAGVILSGGGSSVHTMSDLAKAVLHLPSRFAMLSEGTNSRVELKDGSWAVAYGLTIWGFTQGSGFENQEGGGARDALQAAWRWFKKFLP
ncbi:cell division protein FtsA [Candidatus Adlerbacteria bacterium RIFCSPHIGHO2_12_FULL_53_18]|uniref:Cell division protein FtsA n=1 Tax=Candidatus Adlerbacteria bacterium RIFCSPHIGHO2_12_FULL_53_18 TaxID=1797242 RepID=A0A1F4XSK8_9BACT|nr:MAG: cell division protein FtsA [Candidatus Adlerbacteria bacterium RIFCSPHIGHO2_12_FULL_53_18]